MPAIPETWWRSRSAHVRPGPVVARRFWIAGAATALALVVALVALAVPVPALDGFLATRVAARVQGQVGCGAAPARSAAVTVAGGRLLPQVLRKRFTELRFSAPDVTLGGVRAAVTATLYDVTQPAAGSAHAASVTAAIKVPFANLPSPAGRAVPTYRRARDGGLTVGVLVPAAASGKVRAKLFLKMRLNGATVQSVPLRLEVFGRTLPAAQVADLTGGVRSQRLPGLPAGVTYRSIEPRPDGLHVALGGVATTPLGELPQEIDGRRIDYAVAGGRLAISTSVGVPPIIDLPLTVVTVPRLRGDTLTLQPQSVSLLGADRGLDDPLARLVLSQLGSSLSRRLPPLPAGVGYRSVSVDPAGLKLVISGTTVRPFSALDQPAGRTTVFGAEDGLLTATARGATEDTPIVLHARPRITGTTLDIAPEQIEMFGTRFPARDVLAVVPAQATTHPLQPLPPGLFYRSVAVLPDGLRIEVAGRDVTLGRGALTGGTC
jgi:LmeA-like phospholipid-binding